MRLFRRYLGALLAYYLQGGVQAYAAGCSFAAIQFAVISSTLLVFRWFGYRFLLPTIPEPEERRHHTSAQHDCVL